MSGGLESVYAAPLFGVAVTVIAYAISSAVHHRFRWLPSLVLTCGSLIALLLLCHIPYSAYKSGGDIVSFFLGPATIALGVPFYKHAKSIRAHSFAVFTAVAAGSASGIASAGGLVLLMHGSGALLRSMIPKSVTTPISIELAKQLGGVPPLTAVFTVLAGLLGSVVGPQLLRVVGVRGNIAIGLAMGTSSHGIGTARIIRDSEFQGGASGLAMALAGIITSLLIIPIQWWLH
ncbi:MAG TPA: LrgB family protein [Tepidisphaeraceae bacterium]|jgi:predicted murein hydrolase (TIGR00659 family)|nr:LrgB family protein [Tepidisphaeraceae bacterium]